MNNVPPPIPVEFKDRQTGLKIFGVLTVLGGLVCALFALLMLVGSAMDPNAATNPPITHRAITMVMPFLMYAGMAVTLIWLGVGSIMSRRWARALLLILAWCWLITGVIVISFMAAMIPQFTAAMQSAQPAGQPGLPEAARMGILIFMGAFFSVIFLIIPAVWVFFYGSKHVKATCEAQDPVERWTDRCPLPVIAASLIAAFGALSMLGTAFSFHGAIPFFGIFLNGLPGMLVYFIFALIMGYAAWAMYKLDPLGWWALFAIMCITPISATLTYWHHDIMELYRLAGYSAKEMQAIQQFNFFKGSGMMWFTLLSVLPWLVYLLYVRKFFRRAS